MKRAKRLPALAAGAIITALPYGRVSTDEQEREGLSLDNQRRLDLEYIARQGWEAGEWRQDVESGKHVDRGGYVALLAEARRLRESGRPVAIVISRLDRLGRRLSELARAREELTSLGAQVHSVTEGGLLSDLLAGILATLAEEESRRLGERVASVFEHARAGGWWTPGRLPWGYRARPATAEERAAGAPNSVLAIDEAAAPFVRETFQRAAGGQSLNGIARWLASLPAVARGGRTLSYSAVRPLLASRVYVGEQPDGRPGNWPALVARTDWQAVQDTLAAMPARPPRQASGRHFLTGLLYCPVCGARMNGRAAWRRFKARYMCQAHMAGARHGGRTCRFSVQAGALDADVRAQVEPLIVNAPRLLAAAMRAAAPDELAGGDPDRANAISKAVAFGERARRRLRELTLLLADGTLTREAYKDAAELCRGEAAWADQEQARLQEQPAPGPAVDLDAIIHDTERWRRNWRADATPEQRAILAELVSRVVPVRDTEGSGAVRARISWSLTGQYLRTLMGITDPPTNGAIEAPEPPEQPID